jgi:hypothetical protein
VEKLATRTSRSPATPAEPKPKPDPTKPVNPGTRRALRRTRRCDTFPITPSVFTALELIPTRGGTHILRIASNQSMRPFVKSWYGRHPRTHRE